MNSSSVVDGLRYGVALGACIAVLAVLGLTPSLAWIPELPLIAVTLLLPIAACGLAGRRAGRRLARTSSGALAGGLAGALGGIAGGLAYVAFGKPVLNLAVGLVAGTVGGATAGAAGALTRRAGPGAGARPAGKS